MKKIFTLAVLAILGVGSASAQEVTIDFSGTDNWGIGTDKVQETKSYTYDGRTIKLTPSSGNYFRWYDSGNILLGKQGATLELPAFDFDVERIDVEGTSGASTIVKQNIYVGEEAVSTETTGAKNVTNQYNIDEAKQAAGTIYTLKVTSNHNTQITKIMIYKKGSNAKQQSGLGWDKSTATVTIDANDNEFPTLKNPNSLSVTYSSSKEDVATIDANGNITLVAAGTTDISAIFAGNDTYEESTVTYKLTVKAAIDNDAKGQINNPYTVAEAIEVINALSNGSTTSDAFYVKGYVVGDPDFQRNASNELYGNVNFTIADTKGGETTLTVFRAKDFGNVNFTEETITRIKAGDEVIAYGKLQKYVKNDVTTPELTSCYLYSVNGATTGISSVKSAAEFNGAIYNIAGQKVSASYKGLVIKNGKKIVQK